VQRTTRRPLAGGVRGPHAPRDDGALPANPEPFLGGYADLVETLEAFVA
jgi:hypothetical protein